MIETRSGVTVLLSHEKHVLVLRKPARLSRPALWQFPGGTFEPELDSDLAACAVRETLEETGLPIPPETLQYLARFTLSASHTKPGHSRAFIDYYYTAPAPRPTVTLSTAHIESAWVEPEQALDLLSSPEDCRGLLAAVALGSFDS